MSTHEAPREESAQIQIGTATVECPPDRHLAPSVTSRYGVRTSRCFACGIVLID